MIGLRTGLDYTRWKQDPTKGMDALKKAQSDMVFSK